MKKKKRRNFYCDRFQKSQIEDKTIAKVIQLKTEDIALTTSEKI